MVLYPNKLPESERVCSGICRNDICFIGKHIVLLKNHQFAYYIRQRYSDDKRFIICKNKDAFIGETQYELFYDNKTPYEIRQMKH